MKTYKLFLILLFSSFVAFGQEKTNEYQIELDYTPSLINVEINFSHHQRQNKDKDFLLFNSAVENLNIETNDTNFKYQLINDTLFFTSKYETLNIKMSYTINVKKDKTNEHIPLFSNYSNQIFLERFYRWYPLRYNTFSLFSAIIKTPIDYDVFSFFPKDSVKISENLLNHYFSFKEEDIPLFITATDFYTKETLNIDSTLFNVYFLKQTKRLKDFDYTNKKPIYTEDKHEVDSINTFLYDKIERVYKWYKKNLYQKNISEVNLIETPLGGFGLNSMVTVNTHLINYDLFYKTQIAHEIGHIWLGLNTQYDTIGRDFMSESIDEYVNLLRYEDFYGEKALDSLISQSLKSLLLN